MVDVAIMLISNPPLLLMDEPTNNMDPMLERQTMQAISACRDLGYTIVLTSHR